ncbi:MAG: hypothetical protein QNK04_22805 [Myxococcota bacterium]|nr:hypothetical protein [Myxococcota bacterium]
MSSPEPLGRRSAGAVRRALAFALPASLVLVGLVAGQRADPDLWGRLSVAAVIFEAGHVPLVDDFSYTASGRPWIDHEWLTGVVFYTVLAGSGEPGLLLFKYALAAASLLLVLAAHGRIYRASPLVGGLALALLAAGFLSAYLSTIRAQVFSITGFLVCLTVLERVRLAQWRPRALFGLVPLGVVWANLHGGFVMGLLAVGLYAAAALVERRPRAAALHLGVVAATVLGVALANPYGPAYLGFLLHAWTLDRSGITEWQPLLAGAWSVGQAYLAALVGVAGLLALRTAAVAVWRGGLWPLPARPAPPGPHRGSDLAPALVVLLVVCMALLARRIHSFVALTLAFTLPVLLPATVAARERLERGWPGRLFGVVLPVAACVAAAVLLGTVLRARPVLRTFVPDELSRGVDDRYRYPVGAVRYLRDSPYEGRLLNPFTQGEFLYWALYPRFRVAMDGRYEEVYSQEQFRWVRRFYGVAERKRSAALAAQSGADFVVFRSRGPGAAALEAHPDWWTVYDDGVYAVLGHKRATERHLPFRGGGPRAPGRPTIASFFTAADRARFAGYPRAEEPHPDSRERGAAGAPPR